MCIYKKGSMIRAVILWNNCTCADKRQFLPNYNNNENSSTQKRVRAKQAGHSAYPILIKSSIPNLRWQPIEFDKRWHPARRVMCLNLIIKIRPDLCRYVFKGCVFIKMQILEPGSYAALDTAALSEPRNGLCTPCRFIPYAEAVLWMFVLKACTEGFDDQQCLLMEKTLFVTTLYNCPLGKKCMVLNTKPHRQICFRNKTIVL